MAYSLSNGGVIINDSREIVNAGVVTAISFHGDGSALTGIVSTGGSGEISIGDADITGNLNVSGISTVDYLNASDVNVGGALTVAGNLSASGDISADDYTGVNLNISGISTLGTVKIADGQITATSGVVTYYGDGSQLTGIDITDSDIRIRNLEVTGLSTISGDVSFGANASLTGDLLSGRNANLSGIATVNDIYINNLLYDSNDNVGAAGSILATIGGKLQWVPASTAGVATVFEPGNTFYVAKNGNDDQDGLSPEKSFATISYALSQISNGTNQVLYVAAGEYEETFPLSVPDGLTVKGAGQRSVLVKPTTATETNDGFQLGNASTVEDLTIGQMFKPAGASNNNYAFTFRSGATISSRGPYVSRVTVLNKGSVTSASDPFGYGSADAYPTTAPGGAGVLADGSVLNSASLEASFLLNEVTTFTAGNIGIDMVNGARVEWLNGFSYFASEGVRGRADQTTGLYGAGKTRLKLENPTGGLINGNTVELYDIDGVTGIATGTVDSTSGAYTFLTDGGTGTFTEAGSRRAKAVAFVDTASLSTTQAKFGVSSLDVTGQSTDCINVDPSADFGFGTGDFTVEFWLYRTAATAGATILDMRDAAATDSALSIRENTSDVIEVLIGNSVVLTSSASAISNSTWHHIAVARQGSTLDLFVDGAQEDTGTQSDDLGISQSLTFGADYANTNGTIAYLDELRIEKGAAKYTTPFTPSSTELQGDRGTSILLHLNGLNGATTTTDDIEVYQDIRISGGNTADKLTLADYSQFGAELRSSGCAVEYGNKGVVGDGAGVALRLIGINFSFVGALGDLTNDPSLAVQANEITETNNAEVSYTSIDQGGDFRVGESFYVNQETGDVSFNNTTTDLTSLSSLTITDGTNNSLITPTSGRFGNVQISGQQVASVSGDLDLVTAGAGEVNIYGNTNIVGVLTAQVIAINSVQNGDTSIALDDTGSDGTIRFNTDGNEAGRFTNTNSLQVTNDITAGRNLQASGITTIGGLLDVNGDILGDTATNISGINSVTATNFYGDGSALTNISASNVDLTGTHQSLGSLEVSGITTTTGLLDANGGVSVAGLLDANGSVSIGGSLTMEPAATGVGGIYFDDSVAGIGTLIVIDDASVGGDLGVVGDALIDGNITGAGGTISGFNDIVSPLVRSNLVSTLQVATNFISAGDINVVGVVTAAAVEATNLEVTGISTFQDKVLVAGVGAATTDYATVTLSGLSPSSFNTTYLRQSSGFTLDTGTVASGNALFHSDSNYYYYVAQSETSRMLIWSVVDNSWMAVFNFSGADYTSVTNNQALGSAGIFNATVTANDITADGRNVPQPGSGVTYDTTNLVSIGATIHTSGNAEFVGVITASALDIVNNITVGGTVDGRDIATDGSNQDALQTLTGVSAGSTTLGTFAGTIINDNDDLKTALQDLETAIENASGGGAQAASVAVAATDTDASHYLTFVVDNNATPTQEFVRTDAGISYNPSSNILTVSGVVTAGSYLGDGSQLSDLPPAAITTSVTPTVRANGDALQSGDLWYDTSELRQYTYYDDGGSTQWVPSTPEPTIPGLTFAGNTGVSTVTLGENIFNIVGDGTNVDTNVSVGGSTVTISLTDDIAVARNLSVAGVSTFTGNVEIGGNLNVTGDISYDEITGRNLSISGITTLAGQVNLGDNLVGDGSSDISGINSVTASTFYGNGAGLTGLVTELDFSGDTGAGKIGLTTESLEIRGTAQQVTTIGVGNSVVIGLPNTVRVPQRLYVGGGAFTQVADINSASGAVFSNKIVTISAGLTLNSSDLTAVRNLVQTGIATLNTVNFTGITTTVGNAFVGNDLGVLGTVNANDFNSTSDASKKENVEVIDDALAKVLDLRGVTFSWKNGEGTSAGVLAQEVQKVLPGIVKGEEGSMSVQYNGIIALLLEAVKELSSEVEELKKKVG